MSKDIILFDAYVDQKFVGYVGEVRITNEVIYNSTVWILNQVVDNNLKISKNLIEKISEALSYILGKGSYELIDIESMVLHYLNSFKCFPKEGSLAKFFEEVNISLEEAQKQRIKMSYSDGTLDIDALKHFIKGASINLLPIRVAKGRSYNFNKEKDSKLIKMRKALKIVTTESMLEAIDYNDYLLLIIQWL